MTQAGAAVLHFSLTLGVFVLVGGRLGDILSVLLGTIKLSSDPFS